MKLDLQFQEVYRWSVVGPFTPHPLFCKFAPSRSDPRTKKSGCETSQTMLTDFCSPAVTADTTLDMLWAARARTYLSLGDLFPLASPALEVSEELRHTF